MDCGETLNLVLTFKLEFELENPESLCYLGTLYTWGWGGEIPF